jgi:hypothetical protein
MRPDLQSVSRGSPRPRASIHLDRRLRGSANRLAEMAGAKRAARARGCQRSAR